MKGKLVIFTDNGDYDHQGIIDDNLSELFGEEKFTTRKLDYHHPKNQIKFIKEIIEKVRLGESFTVDTYSPYIIQAAKVFSKDIQVDYYHGEIENGKLIYKSMNHDLNKMFLHLALPLKELV